MRRVLIFFIRAYQYAVSPFFPPSCRFYPTCSAYALEAVERHGPIPGLWFALRRLLRCHPWHPGGFDPVPPVAGSRGLSLSNGVDVLTDEIDRDFDLHKDLHKDEKRD